MNFKIENAYLYDSYVIGGKLEGKGPIGAYIDYINEYKDRSYENDEIDAIYFCIDHLLEKTKLKYSDIDIAIGGELSNQLTTTHYAFRRTEVPVIGIYSACASIALSIGIAGLLLGTHNIHNILVATSSNTQSAEREFRNPNEYGGEKLNTQTFTSTVSASCLLTDKKTDIQLTGFTLGRVIDIGFTDANDFGRAMAPAALETLFEHFKETNTTPKDYDLILTGDLSLYGSKIVKQSLYEHFGNVSNYDDCGMILYDVNNQNVFAGGSGPGTSAGVLLSYVKKRMLDKNLNNVLLCATGALLSPTMVAQKNSIPCVAHIIVLKRCL